VGGDDAGLLAPERLAVLHAPGEAAARLEGEIAAELRAAGADGVRLSRSTLPLNEAVLTRDDASQALLFALNSFAAEIGAGRPVRSLDEALALRLESTVRQMGEVRQTIANAAFTLAFQPIVRLADRAVRHYEALARFADGQAPAEVIPFAENVGLIADLDLAVARMALAHLAELRAAGQSPSIAVNLSPPARSRATASSRPCAACAGVPAASGGSSWSRSPRRRACATSSAPTASSSSCAATGSGSASTTSAPGRPPSTTFGR
jgi:predicted signal transduction protein with EAL and GGDEF domain